MSAVGFPNDTGPKPILIDGWTVTQFPSGIHTFEGPQGQKIHMARNGPIFRRELRQWLDEKAIPYRLE